MIARCILSSFISQQTGRIYPLLPTLAFDRSCVKLGSHKQGYQQGWIGEALSLEITALFSFPYFFFFPLFRSVPLRAYWRLGTLESGKWNDLLCAMIFVRRAPYYSDDRLSRGGTWHMADSCQSKGENYWVVNVRGRWRWRSRMSSATVEPHEKIVGCYAWS